MLGKPTRRETSIPEPKFTCLRSFGTSEPPCWKHKRSCR
uniref:Uncharacterized protein n=1 Tax=Rhizophora mucronata TaxID=61149 RepID=A0A2P2NE69_RHIMU